jgi:hypothetical protein
MRPVVQCWRWERRESSTWCSSAIGRHEAGAPAPTRLARKCSRPRGLARLLPLAPLDIETPENLQLSEQNRLLEVDCRWQALTCRKHRELLSARGDAIDR